MYVTDAVVYTALFMSKYYHHNAEIQRTDGETETGRDFQKAR